MSVLKLPLLVELQHEVSELVLSTIHCPTIMILEKIFKIMCRKMWL
jgi:hypothetical protein